MSVRYIPLTSAASGLAHPLGDTEHQQGSDASQKRVCAPLVVLPHRTARDIAGLCIVIASHPIG